MKKYIALTPYDTYKVVFDDFPQTKLVRYGLLYGNDFHDDSEDIKLYIEVELSEDEAIILSLKHNLKFVLSPNNLTLEYFKELGDFKQMSSVGVR